MPESPHSLLRRHVALPADHGSWALLGSPLVIGLVAGGRLVAPSWLLVIGALAAFLIRQPLTIAVKIASGRRGAQDRAAAWLWVAIYGVIGMTALTILVALGFGFVLSLAVPAALVFGWYLALVARREERRQMLLEIVATGALALVAPAAAWIGRGRPHPEGWALWAVLWAASAASIVFAYLRLAQREFHADLALTARLRLGAGALGFAAANLLGVVGAGAAGLLPRALALPYAFRLAEALEGTLRPAAGWKPRRIGFRLLWGAVLFTLLFVATWRP